MDNDNKRVKASEYYSRRIKDKEDGALTSEKDFKRILESGDNEKISITNYSGNTKGNAFRKKSPDLKSVSKNLKEAVEKGASRSPDEVRMLSRRIIAVEAAAAAEYKSFKAVKETTHGTVHAVRYTVTRFSKENRQKRREYKEYHRNRKEIKQKKKIIRNIDKEEKKEKEPVILEKYKNKKDKLTKEKKALENRNKGIRKQMTAKRHSRRVNSIKESGNNLLKNTGKTIIKTPNRMALMIADDMEAERLVMTSSLGFMGTVTKIMAGTFKLFLFSLKNILIAISPFLFAGIFIMFMIYIIFFSDFESYFDWGNDKNIFSSEAGTENNVNEIIKAHINNRCNQMAQEKIKNDESTQVYFVKINDDKINEVRTYMEELSRKQGSPSWLFNDWIASLEGRQALDELAEKMCYWLTDEEAAAYAEENLEAYSGNISPPLEESTEEDTDNDGIPPGIGAGSSIGIIVDGKVEPEKETEPEKQVNKAIIGYYLTNDIRKIIIERLEVAE